MVWKVVLFISILLLSCEEKGKESNSTPALPSEIVEDFKLNETEQGKKVYSLKAEKAYLYKSLHRIDVVEPRITFFDEKGGVFSTLSSQKGRIDTRTYNLLAKGDVVVRTRDSTILYTDSLIWDQRKRIITTQAWVRVKSPTSTLEGEGLVSDASLQRIEITHIKGESPYRFRQ